MGKNIIVALFVAILAAAIFVFIQRDKQDKSERVGSKDQVPRISLEDFTVYKYEQHKTVSTISGRFANFVDPDQLEIFGSVQGFNHKAKKKEFFASESATVQFAAKGVVDLAKNSRIIKTEIENQVRFGYDDLILYTDYARYLNEEGRLTSDLPVRIQGPQLELKGEKGFDFNNNSGDLKVYGPLEGTMRAADKPQ
jgi:LPS export ABC transporter protein LptC